MIRPRKVPPLVTVVLLVATVTSVGIARGNVLTVQDPDDSPGGFDIVSIRQAHTTILATGQKLLRHRIRTAEPWSSMDLLDGDSLEIWFNLDGDSAPERRLTVTSEVDGTLYAMMRDEATGRIRGYAKVWKATPSVLVVEFPWRLLENQRSSYRWYVFSTFHEEGNPDCGTVDDMWFVCGDRAPDRGWVLHRMNQAG